MADETPTLTNKNLLKARKLLFDVAAILDQHQIVYHLEGGTLLGIVRDQDLLPWDHDIDISILGADTLAFLKLRSKLYSKGYKLSVRTSKKNHGPIKMGNFSVFKIKPLKEYVLSWFLPAYKKQLVVLDVFVKEKDETHTYWQAKEKVMRVANKYYESFDTVTYLGHTLKVPNHYRDYLTEKYGDWSIPVKEWDCGENELTIIK